jgi:adenylosuccinate lyase
LDLQQDGLHAISALDGRYWNKIKDLSPYVSEAALIEKRIYVELSFLEHLSSQPQIAEDIGMSKEVREKLCAYLEKLPGDAAERVKTYEQQTNHDVKAVEYYIRDLLSEAGAQSSVLAFIHFACTSEDINNLAYALILKDVRSKVFEPVYRDLLSDLRDKSVRWADLAMLSRTHGQSASPTSLGKEMAVFTHRLAKVYQRFSTLKLEAKLNGAVGNFNAHYVAYPDCNWPEISRSFIEERLGLSYNPLTTQIENHDSMVELVECVRRFNTIALGLCRDMWAYISNDYFKLEVKANEVGSSTMPHKVNPIDFENSEGNLGLANALAVHLSEKLPISRWQRDLSDSTVQRSLGSFFGYSLLAYKSLAKGLSKVSPNVEAIACDLDDAWEVLAEPVQTVLRRYGVMDAYERLKAATRGQKVSREVIENLITASPEIPDAVKAQLLALSPSGYTGIAQALANFDLGM